MVGICLSVRVPQWPWVLGVVFPFLSTRGYGGPRYLVGTAVSNPDQEDYLGLQRLSHPILSSGC